MQVLFIHYLRFKPIVQGEEVFSVKIRHEIAANPNFTVKQKTYHLVGVLRHRGGSANSGHYYFTTIWPPYLTTRRAYRNNNDDEVEELDQYQLQDDVRNAYMLVYQLADEQLALSTAEGPVSVGNKSVPPTAATSAGKQQAGNDGIPTGSASADNVSSASVGSSPDANPSSDHANCPDEEKGERRSRDVQPDVDEQATSAGKQQAGNDGIPTGSDSADNVNCPDKEEKRRAEADVGEQGVSAASDGQQRGREVPAESPAASKKGPLSNRASAENVSQSRENTATEGDEGEKRFREWLRHKEAIGVIKPSERSKEQQSQYKSLSEKINKSAHKYPHIQTKPPPKTGAERIRNLRKNNAEYMEKEREDDRARKATDEYLEKDRAKKATQREDEEYRKKEREGDRAKKATDEYLEKDRAKKAAQRQDEEYREKEQERDSARKAAQRQDEEYRQKERAADLQRKTAKKSGITFKARDGLKAELTLTGKFAVPVNFLGAMDQVSACSSIVANIPAPCRVKFVFWVMIG